MTMRMVLCSILLVLGIVTITTLSRQEITTAEDAAPSIVVIVSIHKPTPTLEPTPTPTPTTEPTAEPTPTGTTIRAEVTAYCACPKCNGTYSSGNETETASGIILKNEPAYADKYCAATAAVGDMGDIVIIDGIKYEIVDRMGRKHGRAIDIFVPDHDTCYEEYGRRRNYEVEVIEK